MPDDAVAWYVELARVISGLFLCIQVNALIDWGFSTTDDLSSFASFFFVIFFFVAISQFSKQGKKTRWK